MIFLNDIVQVLWWGTKYRTYSPFTNLMFKSETVCIYTGFYGNNMAPLRVGDGGLGGVQGGCKHVC